MTVLVVLGGQYGDEGKGKIADYLGHFYDIGIRPTAGDNAGHTVVVDGKKLSMRHLYSAAASANFSIIGDDVLLNLETFFKEIDMFAKAGHDLSNKVFVSQRAELVLPYHIAADSINESGKRAFGTTKRGVGPAMADRVSRIGLRVEDCFDLDGLAAKIKDRMDTFNKVSTAIHGETSFMDPQAVIDQILPLAKRLQPFIKNTTLLIHQAVKENRSILVEGAQAAMLDLTYGAYPYVTSSRPVSSGLMGGVGIGPRYVNTVLSVIKPYQTRVGIGPVMAEMVGDEDETAKHIREVGGERGVNTGRDRRIMWLDTVVLRYSNMINGTNVHALMKLDVLDDRETIKVCTGYRLNGQVIKDMPMLSELANCEPVYQELPGWQTPTSHIRSYADLPQQAKDLITLIEQETEVPIAIISVGPDREYTIEREHVAEMGLKPGQSYQNKNLGEPTP